MERPIALAEYIEIGVFKGKRGKESLREPQAFEITAKKSPRAPGIDPYNKLIDRIAHDNMTDISIRQGDVSAQAAARFDKRWRSSFFT
jgi:hypothetical protein